MLYLLTHKKSIEHMYLINWKTIESVTERGKIRGEGMKGHCASKKRINLWRKKIRLELVQKNNEVETLRKLEIDFD